MSNWLTNKGAGPWPFVPQPDKLGYVNNPRWTTTPASPVDHEPCGHWWKEQLQEIEGFILYGTGFNAEGQLGLDDVANRNVLTWIMDGVKQVSSGEHHTFVLKPDGTLWATGLNASGQLGLGDTVDRLTFVQVGSDKDWVQVACGEHHTLAIKTNGTLWGTGSDASGQLGQDPRTDRQVLTQIGTANNWRQVETGDAAVHTHAIRTDGTLWATGRNDKGELGLGHNISPWWPFTQIGVDTDWESIAAGQDHFLAIKTNGTLWATGFNFLGQLGLGDNADRNTLTQVGVETIWKSITCSDVATLALKTDGRLWGTGSNLEGRLGLGAVTLINVFTQVGIDTLWDSIALGQTGSHSLSRKTDGSLWATGRNSSGQLGLGDSVTRTVFTRVGNENDWKNTDAGRNTSFALKVSTVNQPSDRTTPVWPMPTA